MTSTFDQAAFAAQWNALERSDRLRLRRLVRAGRAVDADDELLARDYARWQVQRPWIRFFWLWFVPGIVVLMSVAAQFHPLFVGVAVALAAQAVWAWFSLRKLARRAD